MDSKTVLKYFTCSLFENVYLPSGGSRIFFFGEGGAIVFKFLKTNI